MATNNERQKAFSDYQISLGKQRLSCFISAEHKQRFDDIKKALGVTNETCLQMLIDAFNADAISVTAPSSMDALEQRLSARIEALEDRLARIESAPVPMIEQVQTIVKTDTKSAIDDGNLPSLQDATAADVSAELRRQAVAFKATGASNKDVLMELEKALGRKMERNFSRNLSNHLNNWKDAKADKTESLLPPWT